MIYYVKAAVDAPDRATATATAAGHLLAAGFTVPEGEALLALGRGPLREGETGPVLRPLPSPGVPGGGALPVYLVPSPGRCPGARS